MRRSSASSSVIASELIDSADDASFLRYTRSWRQVCSVAVWTGPGPYEERRLMALVFFRAVGFEGVAPNAGSDGRRFSLVDGGLLGGELMPDRVDEALREGVSPTVLDGLAC